MECLDCGIEMQCEFFANCRGNKFNANNGKRTVGYMCTECGAREEGRDCSRSCDRQLDADLRNNPGPGSGA